ncbi:Dehydrogenase (flavoprotein) [Reichenbachiella faecimaris]|uniref:Dehydrogenase (Flavoprotein) n=1 Tax=Reichenbachiella faecimaris TaxID=692418 RepID=A0A1W2GF24_REIFA|nr:NAD(P)/FAD-dependent oxidoreductase [Reichenbachiella faecimaris]SMD34948.1 Dehydrogenase (flavoprotein) [Reichenbachiella faecimaris]
MYDVIVIGGGIAGLINSILLSRAGLHVALFEKKSYPFHRVCGEYISNEVKPFLMSNDLYPKAHEPAQISKFKLTSINGNVAHLPLKMGGFGISRYVFDEFLFQQAQSVDVTVFQAHTVSDITFEGDAFHVLANRQSYSSKIVIGSFGKRSALDRGRIFMQKKSPYLGVKYHIKTNLPADEIALHNFQEGYCGISQIEDGTFNLCYLSHRENLRKHKTIEEMESKVLHQNPFLKNIWDGADFLFEKPEVINEISFEKKELIHNHILMCGDTAGMITPLCGNGMAIAIRSAKLLSELIILEWSNGDVNRKRLEEKYAKVWNQHFASRLWVGRQIQKLFGANQTSNFSVQLAKINPIGKAIVKLTHGSKF